MKLLAFETATEACSVALYVDGTVVERFELAPRRHAELALPWAEALLADAGIARSALDAIACGRGPGAFTGVRLAIALSQGIALALDRPVVAVSTLAALAMADRSGLPVLSAIDARMGEVYSALFVADADGLVTLAGEERVHAPAAVPLPSTSFACVGSGLMAQDGELARRCAASGAVQDAAALPHAAAVARLAARAFDAGLAVAPERLEPAYLRNKVALTLAEQRRG